MVSPESKIIAFSELTAWRNQTRQAHQRVVATNGCFDLLHAGHVTYLHTARSYGDLLIIGLNSDTSVRALKGPDRPINSEADRAIVLAALQCVDAVCIFNELRAVAFLQNAQPDIYVKGGDLALDQIPVEERRAVEAYGGKIHIMPHVAGRSTTHLINRLRSTP
jgi:rfaE bifunctional protein nucleotidyltransferase chain/domain